MTQKYSVMVLPRRSDGSILMQILTGKKGTFVDGFGSFYQTGELPQTTATKVLKDNNIDAKLTLAANLQYYIQKPEDLVDLKVTVFMADINTQPKVSQKMKWYAPENIPYDQIHESTVKWLPLILSGQVPLVATIRVNQPNDHTTGKVVKFTVTNRKDLG